MVQAGAANADEALNVGATAFASQLVSSGNP
jgi:hypothetical protein